MITSDFDEFSAVLQATAELYPQRTLSASALALYWQALQDLGLLEVKAGLSQHINSPDVGQFMPKPADIRKALGGTTQDAALMAWAKVLKAVKLIGAYSTVTFDDPFIHAALTDMGGWVAVCHTNEDELPFREKEFVAKYRAYRAKPATELAFVPKLIGLIDQHNLPQGHDPAPVALIGKQERAERVLAKGSARDWLRVTYKPGEGLKPALALRLGIAPAKPKPGTMSPEDVAAMRAAEAEIAARESA